MAGDSEVDAAMLALPPDPDEDGHEKLFADDALRFDPGPWERSAIFARAFELESGGQLRFHAPRPLAQLNDPLMTRCLANPFEPEPGVRWGGLRINTFDGSIRAFYVVTYEGEFMTAEFRGTVAEEALADALFESLRQSDDARASTPHFFEVKGTPIVPRAQA